jgi:general secretion pathway protein D
LGDIPIVGRLFRNQTDDREKTEIVLLITPRIVRTINWPQSAVIDTPVGTDTSIGSAPLRIAQTASGALALAPGQGAGAARQPTAPAPAVPSPAQEAAPAEPPSGLLIAAPLAAKTGNEFLVSVGLPPGTSAVSARLELAFDPTQLEPIGAAVSAPGRLPLKVDGTASVRFKVVAQQGRAQVRAEQVIGLDASGGNVPMVAPAPVDITITP